MEWQTMEKYKLQNNYLLPLTAVSRSDNFTFYVATVAFTGKK